MTSKFALVIANTEYQDASFAKLTAPGKDAEEFAHVLREPELAAFDDVQVLLNDGESKIRRSIARFFVDRKRDDLLLLYFSGHGIRNEQGQLFLAANDTEIKILEASGIPADFVTQSMNNSRSQRQLLILDCCNSGAFAYGSKSASAVGKSMGIATAFEGSGFGRVVLTATDATQYAWEGDKVIGGTQKSVFTHFLIEGLKGEADRDSDGRIHVDELYDYAFEQVVRRTPRQTPGKWSYKQQGEMLLRDNLKPRDVKPAPLPSDLIDLLSHPNSGVRKVGMQDLISLLDGKHLGLARAAEEKLREIADNDDSLTLRQAANGTLISHGFELKKPAPVEILKEGPREEKKIEKLPGVQPRNLPGQKKVVPNLNLRLIGSITGGLLLITFLIWGGSNIFNNLSTTSRPTQTLQPIATRTSLPTKINTPTPTQTSIPPTPTLGIGSTMISEKDGMTLLYVPAGEFTMGSRAEVLLALCQKFYSCLLDWFRDEDPPHVVSLDAFWIDQTEVTNAMYSLCVEAGSCEQPSNTDHYSNEQYAQHPVVFVSWNGAKNYCLWAGRRLPTEAEWEKAARGENSLFYPWGNNFDSTRLNFCDKNCSFSWADKSSDDGYSDTAPVGSYPRNASPYGTLDMVGNIWEWSADWYSETYYATSPASNPGGPESGSQYVYRGGGWASDLTIRSVDREGFPINGNRSDIGFRCAVSATP